MTTFRNATNRREFLRRTSAATAGLAIGLPTIITRPRDALGTAPSDQIRIGHIGVGRQGMRNMTHLLPYTVAVCDVDQKHLAAAKALVDKANGGDCAAYSDYRRMLDDKNIDAVVVSTPDHWHALPSIHACQAGKDVYCEKPLTLTIEEGQVMVAAARRYERIVQTGSQQRSMPQYRQACELALNGRLGNIHTIRAEMNDAYFTQPAVPDSDPPPELDYDFWIGSAPMRPYNVNHVHSFFRFFWDFAGGQMTNWGAHNFDIAQWAMGTDDSGPTSIEASGQYDPQNRFETPKSSEAVFTYPSGIKVIAARGEKFGNTIQGDKGTVYVSRKQIVCDPPELAKEIFGNDEIHLYKSNDHYQNWLDCIKSRKLPICDVAIGHRTATMCHLANIALRTGRKVNWDPAKEEIVGDSEAAAMVSRPRRSPWELPKV